jgi:hypothetical protein
LQLAQVTVCSMEESTEIIFSLVDIRSMMDFGLIWHYTVYANEKRTAGLLG